MPVSTRGLLRANVVLTDDETDEDGTRESQQRVARAERAKASHARRKEQPKAVHNDGGEAR